ncbi:MAG: Rpn family recombination-promoting nuclease/putative transposase [Lachnospiraceae bacterium]|nr:Rpn family recombination-promoting nuclease/putative transposase [Lachnospiraceae bacterium]
MNTTNLTGPLTIPMTNDYLFRALLQQNNKVLKGLISSLLHLSLDEIISVEITNPIELGKSIDAKDFFLDIKVLLNSDTIINLEMQVINQHNWPERSLSYLCRSFDGLNRGEDYLEARPVIQISLLDFTLFPAYPEFYATYQLLNVKNYIKYSDKLCLHVLDLTRTDLATEKDKQHQIDYWAALFKATTWEELRMLADKNESIAEAAETVYRLSEEEKIRLQCEAREDYYRCQRDAAILLERAERGKQEAQQQTQNALKQVQDLKQQVKQLTEELEQLRTKQSI